MRLATSPLLNMYTINLLHSCYIKLAVSLPELLQNGDGSLTFSLFNSLFVSFLFGGSLVTSVALVIIIESIPEKNQTHGFDSPHPQEFLGFLLNPLKFQTKQGCTPRNSTKLY